MVNKPKTGKYIVMAGIVIILEMPIVLVGAALCATVIFIPAGLGLIFMTGAIPAALLKKRIKIITHYQFTDGLTDKTVEGDVPWEL